MLTRYDPPLPLHRLRVEGRLFEIRAADLAFTSDPTRLPNSSAGTTCNWLPRN